MSLRLLSQQTVATMLEISVKTLRRWVHDGEFPPPVSLPNGLTRWNSAAVEAWISTRMPEAVKKNPGGQDGPARDRAGQIEPPAGDPRKGR